MSATRYYNHCIRSVAVRYLTCLEQCAFDVIVYEVDALSLLSVVQTLLRYVQWNLEVDDHLLQSRLGARQCIDLSDHLIGLVAYLRLPVLDVSDAVSEPAPDVVLRPSCFVVCLAAQSHGVQTDSLGARTSLVRRNVVGDIRSVPVV